MTETVETLKRERDESRREICDAFGKSWAYPMTDNESWQRAYEEGQRAEAKRRGWEGLYT